MAGVQFNPMALYSPVAFPVTRGTPMLNSLIQWDHEQTWAVPKFEDFMTSSGGAGAVSFEIDTSSDSADNYILGHKVVICSQ